MKRISGAVLFAAIAAAVLHAHGNMEHVLGTVTAVDEYSISVKASDGSTQVVAIDDETHFLKGDSPASLKDVQIGSRVVIHAHKHEGKLEAAEVKIGMMASVKKR